MSGLSDVKLHFVDSIDDILALFSWLGERRSHHALAFDTETTGLVVGSDVVRLAQVGDAHHGWVIPWETGVGADGKFIGAWSGLFADIVKRWDGWLLAHNAKFDVGMLDHMRVKMPRSRVLDTRIMAHCLWPQYSTALKSVADRLVDGASSATQSQLSKSLSSEKGGGWTWATVPLDHQDYWVYAGLDPVLTYRVFEEMWPQVEADCPDAFELENSVSWVILNMERYGVHIDVDYAREKYDEFVAYVDAVERWCVDTYRVKPGSNAAIVKILQEAGFEFTKATQSGAVALDKEVLGNIDHPLAEAVLSRRRLQKLASTYLRHFIAERDDEGLIHPNINVLGARTSRMSMDNPNLQNLPRKSEFNPAADAIRRAVTTRYAAEGRLFGRMLMCDFDQVEMRLLASLAQERTMIDAFKGDTDFFVALARTVYQDDAIVKSDARRQVVKNAGYATIYGAGVEKFSATAGIDVQTGQWVRQRWNELYPRVLAFQNEVQRVALQRRETEGVPYVRCPITRRRQVADPGKEYALVNYLIQGAAAAIFKRKILELDAAGLGQWMCVPVHDEIILDVPDEHVADAAEVLRKVMNDSTVVEVPLTASVSHGVSWGSKEAYK